VAKKWSRPVVIAVGTVGLMASTVVLALTWVELREHWRVHIDYKVDLPATPVDAGWATYGPDPVLYLLKSDPASGVLWDAPSDPVFRGVILSGPDLPGNGTIQDYRVFRDGYYVEFYGGTVRYVLDPAPWLAIRGEVQSSLDVVRPGLWQALVDAGVT